MSAAIQDRFSGLAISRQRKYQLRRQAAGLCTTCGESAVTRSGRCLKHLVMARERSRKRISAERRYSNAASYQIEAGLASAIPLTKGNHIADVGKMVPATTP